MKGKTRASDRSSVDKEGKEEAAIYPSIKTANYGDLLWVQFRGSSWWPAQVVDESTITAIHKPRERTKGDVLVRLYGSYKYLFIDPISSQLEFENILDKYNGSHNAILRESLEQDLRELRFGTSKKKLMKMKGKVVKQNLTSRTETKKILPSASRNEEQGTERKKRKTNGAASPRTSTGSASGGATPKTSRKRASSSSDESEQWNNKKKKHYDTRKNLSPNTPNSDAAKTSQAKKDAGRKKNAKAIEQEILSMTKEEPAKEPSARQLKIMRFLGLIAPSGSPFIRKKSISGSAKLTA